MQNQNEALEHKVKDLEQKLTSRRKGSKELTALYTKLQKEYEEYKKEMTDKLETSEMTITSLQLKLEKFEKENAF